MDKRQKDVSRENRIRRRVKQGANASGQENIWKSALEMKPDPQKKKESLMLIRSCIESKKIRVTPSFHEMARIQLSYISPVFWILQGGLLALLVMCLYRLSGQEAELTDYLWWSSIGAAWMGVLSQGMLGRNFASGMAELEQCCYVNLTQMWTIRMILTTSVDIFALTVFSGGIAACTDTFFGRIAVYLLVPFMLSNACCLLTIRVIRGGRGKYKMMALAVMTSLFAVSPSVLPVVYTAAYLWVWLCVLLTGAAVFAGQLRACYYRIMRGDIICWN